MKEFLSIEKLVPKEPSYQQGQELKNSMVTKIDESESCDKNPATLGNGSSFKNQVGVEADILKANEHAVEDTLYSSNQTDLLERSSVVSKKSENSYSDNSSRKTSKLFLKLIKSSQSNNLDKTQFTDKNSDQTSVYSYFKVYKLFKFSLKLNCDQTFGI